MRPNSQACHARSRGSAEIVKTPSSKRNQGRISGTLCCRTPREVEHFSIDVPLAPRKARNRGVASSREDQPRMTVGVPNSWYGS